MLKTKAVLILNDSRERELTPKGEQFTMDELFQYLESQTITHLYTFDKKALLIIDVDAWSTPKKPKNIRASLYALNSAQGDGIRGKAIVINDLALVDGLFTENVSSQDENVQIDQQLYDQR